MNARRKLPIGVQTFSEIIEGGYYYVDKTPFVRRMVEQGKYFLSRPRRFGKSLLLDTLKELFEGSNEALFQGLSIHGLWDWSRRHPVVRISFGSGVLRSREELDRRIRYLLRSNRLELGLPVTSAEDIAI